MEVRKLNRLKGIINEHEIEMYNNCIKNYIEQSCDTIYYYAVNREASDVDEIYGETTSSELVLEKPIILTGIFRYIGEVEQKTYLENSTLTYKEDSNVEVELLLSCLKENNVNICQGDYFAYRFTEDCPIFYQIYNDGSNNNSPNHKILGYKPHSITIKAKPVDTDKLKIS